MELVLPANPNFNKTYPTLFNPTEHEVSQQTQVYFWAKMLIINLVTFSIVDCLVSTQKNSWNRFLTQNIKQKAIPFLIFTILTAF